jgi:iron complex outermembrane receptor protein
MAVCALVALASAAAQAEPPINDQSAVQEEIVVLGTREQGYRATVAPLTNKSDTPIKETPFSVQVVTHELIRDRGITTVGEALRYVPGFSPQVGFGEMCVS